MSIADKLTIAVAALGIGSAVFMLAVHLYYSAKQRRRERRYAGDWWCGACELEVQETAVQFRYFQDKPPYHKGCGGYVEWHFLEEPTNER